MTDPTLNSTNGQTILSADFAVVECLLQDQQDWGAEVLRYAGFPAAYWRAAARKSQYRPSKIFPDSQNRFLAYGYGGKWLALSYQVERLDENRITITPADYLDARRKLSAAVLLSLFGGWAVLLAPLAWDLLAYRNRLVSRRLMPAFCRYLTEKLNHHLG